jgi:hypothetical protein
LSPTRWSTPRQQRALADLGFAWAAWIIDPGKNALGILQIKQ